MGLTLEATPNKTVLAIVSNVNAGITQLPYTFKRQDFQIGDMLNESGFIRLQLTAGVGNVTAQFAVGDSLFVDPIIFPSFIANVTAVSFLGNTLVDLDEAFTQAGETGTSYTNLLTGRSDYAVNVIFEDVDNSLVFTEQVFVYKPSQAGNLFLDFGGVVISYMENLPIEFLSYRIQYRENYTGVDLSYTSDVIILSLLAERGIGQLGGSNLWDKLLRFKQQQFFDGLNNSVATPGRVRLYQGDSTNIIVGTLVKWSGFLPVYPAQDVVVLSIDSATEITISVVYISDGGPTTDLTNVTNTVGKFLTHFKEPNVWNGWKQTVSYIVDANINARTGATGVRCRFNEADINKNGGALAYDVDVNTDVAIRAADVIYQPGAFYLIAQLGDQVFFNQFSDQLFFLQQEECKNPIMVTWVNSLGTREYNLFNIKQNVILSAEAGLIYQPEVQADVETLIQPNRRINSDEILKIVCIAEVPIADIRAMHEIKTAEVVRVFLTKDGTKEIGVTINEGFETPYNTDDKTVEFSVIIEFPKDYDFFSIKEY